MLNLAILLSKNPQKLYKTTIFIKLLYKTTKVY